MSKRKSKADETTAPAAETKPPVAETKPPVATPSPDMHETVKAQPLQESVDKAAPPAPPAESGKPERLSALAKDVLQRIRDALHVSKVAHIPEDDPALIAEVEERLPAEIKARVCWGSRPR